MSTLYDKQQALLRELSRQLPDRPSGSNAQVSSQSQRIPNQRSAAERIPLASIYVDDAQFFIDNPSLASRYNAANVQRYAQIYFPERLYGSMPVSDLASKIIELGMAALNSAVQRNVTVHHQIYRVQRGSYGRSALTQFPDASKVKEGYSLA